VIAVQPFTLTEGAVLELSLQFEKAGVIPLEVEIREP